MTLQWYALHSKAMKEALLCEQLSLHAIESFYPRLRLQPANPRARKFKAYFPGYIFGRLDFEQINLTALWWLPGAAGIVSFDGVPSHIPDNLIAAIRRRVSEINVEGARLLDSLQAGDMVTIQEGPFNGYEAIFDAHVSDDERVRVLLRLLNKRQFPLELSGRQIRRKKQ